jgi:hypothetical protein
MLQSKFNQENIIKINKKTGIGLLALFFISRVIFINANDVFFDSKEYLELFANPNLYKAIITGHTPIHEGYILLFWPVYHLAQFLRLDPGLTIVLGQIFLAVLTIYCLYKSIAFISDRNIALFSAIIFSLTPLFWITNVTITLEITYLSFFSLSLYLLTLYLSKNNLYYLLLSFICFGVSFVTYSAVVLWLPLYLAFTFFTKRQAFIKVFIGISLFLFITFVTRLLILSVMFHGTPLLILRNFYLSNITQVGNVGNNLNGLLIFIRNFIPILRNYTGMVFILSLLSLGICFISKKKYFFIGLLWIIPILYINQWWDSVLMGRYGILAGFGFAFLTGYLINRYRFLATLLLLYLLIVSIPTLSLLRLNIPYIQEEQFVKTLPKNSLLIESHFALPQLQNCCQLKILGVNRPDIGNAKIMVAINYYLKKKKPVFVSSAALSDPYGLYTGPYLHPLSLSYDHQFELNPLLTDYKWKVYKIINKKDNLIMYKILSPGKSQYPEVMNLKRSYRRLDYYDPITRLWWFAEDLFSPGNKK